MHHGTLKHLVDCYNEELLALDTYDLDIRDVILDILRAELLLVFFVEADGQASYFRAGRINHFIMENADAALRYYFTHNDSCRFLSMSGPYYRYTYHGSEVLEQRGALRLESDIQTLQLETQFEHLETGRMYPPMRPSIMAYPEYQRVQPPTEEVRDLLEQAASFFDDHLMMLDFRLVNCLSDLCFIGQNARYGRFYLNFYECYEVMLTRTERHQATTFHVKGLEERHERPLWRIEFTYDHLHITALVNGVEWKALPDHIQSLDEGYFKEGEDTSPTTIVPNPDK